ncbi:MAG: RES family NAD+ phosphorylase [Candidatus Aminicenantes bacterium]|nr:MAG: RES family NAD+ phosphorylase [Candidatus Aminicenantes bacterium]
MKVYRIAKAKFISDLSGTGARLYGGRWNNKGIGIIYTSETRALATVEYLVHVPLAMVPNDLCIATLEIPDHITAKEILKPDLPGNWRSCPAPFELAQLGTSWALANETLLLRVPSVVVEHEFNILINPLHPDMKHVTISRIENYSFDHRLIE